MLPRSERLTQSSFSQCFKTGRRVHTPVAFGVVCPAPSRYGSVVVGKKIARRAVTRNTLRRRAYDVLRRETVGAVGTFIIVLKPGFGELSRQEQLATVKALVGRMKKSA